MISPGLAVDYDSFRRSSGDGVRMLCRTRYIKSHVPQVTYEHVTISFSPNVQSLLMFFKNNSVCYSYLVLNKFL